MSIFSVPEGGTGRDTLTGIIKGAGTSPVVQAVDGTDYISPAAILSQGILDGAKSRGLIRMHEPNGLTSAASNTAALQSYAEDLGDWQDAHLPLSFQGGGYLFDDSIEWAARTGIPSVRGAGGEPIWHPESAYVGASPGGGLVTRMVWGDTDYGKAMWELQGHGGVIEAFASRGSITSRRRAR